MKKHFIAIAFFILITLLFTFPIIFKMSTAVYGPLYNTDSRGTIWQMWWSSFSYENKLDYKIHSTVAAPYGNDMRYFPEGFLWQIIIRWLPIWTNEIFAYNLILILSFVFASIVVYLLTYFITKDIFASFISGLIFGFCPYHFQRSWEHFSLAQIQWPALYFFSLLRLYKSFNWKNCVFFIISTTLVLHLEFNYSYIIFILTMLFFIFLIFNNIRENLVIHKRNTNLFLNELKLDFKFLMKTIFLSTLTLLVNFHFILSILKLFFISPVVSPAALEDTSRPFHYLFSQSARVLNYLVPSSANPILGGLAKALKGTIFYGRGPVEQTLYLGYVPIILAWFAWKRSKRESQINQPQDENFYIRLCVFIAIGGVVFSMPPYFNLGIFKIYFPSFFMYKILPMFRAYARFGLLTIISVSVLAGVGLKCLLQNIKKANIRIMIFALVICLVLFEFNNIPPLHVTDVTNPPAVYKWLSEQKDDIIIAEYPLKETGPGESNIDLDNLFYQRIHRKRLVDGAFPGTIACKIKEKIKKITDPQTPAILKWLGTKYVIVHLEKYKTRGNTEIMDIIGDTPDLSKHRGLQLTKKFKDIEVYEVVANPIEPKLD